MVLQTHGQPAAGLVLVSRMFRMKGGYGIMGPTGFLSVKLKGGRWGLWLNNQLLSGELEAVKEEGQMPFITGPWLLSYVVLLPNELAPGSRGPIASLYTSQVPYRENRQQL